MSSSESRQALGANETVRHSEARCREVPASDRPLLSDPLGPPFVGIASDDRKSSERSRSSHRFIGLFASRRSKRDGEGLIKKHAGTPIDHSSPPQKRSLKRDAPRKTEAKARGAVNVQRSALARLQSQGFGPAAPVPAPEECSVESPGLPKARRWHRRSKGTPDENRDQECDTSPYPC